MNASRTPGGAGWRAAWCAACVGLTLSAAPVRAQESWPARPIHIVVPFSPGTAVDGIGRAVGDYLAREWKASVVVENREGAGGIVGSAAVAGARPDGYTLLLGTQAIVTAIFLSPTPPFDPVRDFAPLVKVGSAPLVLFVSRDSKYPSLAALVADARANPQALSYAHAGPGSSGHLGTEVLKRALGFAARDIGYKAQPQAMIDTVTGRVSFAMANVPVARAQLEAGTLRALGTGARTRMANLPNVPTFAEVVGQPDFELGVWYGFVMPAGTPAPLQARLREGIVKAVADPAVRRLVENALGGGTVEIEDSARFATRIREEKETYRKLIADLGLTPKS